MLKRNKTINRKKKQKGQSTVEYIILVAAVIGILIVFLRPGGVFQNAYNDTLSQGTNGMVNMAQRLRNSRPLSQ
jgi:competence protein ComGC